MRLSPCGCRAEHYQRAQRAWWMKVLPARRLYHCFACDSVLLVAPRDVERKRLELVAAPAGRPVAAGQS